MRTTVENLYKNASYSYNELFILLAYGFLIGFMFSFDNWGGSDGKYDRDTGIQNLILYSIASIIVVFLFTYIQKIIGIFVGVTALHRVSWAYLLISILLCFVTSGKVVIFIPPTLYVQSIDRLLIGRKPYGLSIKNLRIFALLPIISLVFISVLFSEVIPLAPHIASALFWTCFFTALYSLIPIEFLINIPLVFAKEKAEVVLSEHVTDKAETRGASLGSILAYGGYLSLIFAVVLLLCSLISQITEGFWFTAVFALVVAFLTTAIYFVKAVLK